MKTISSLRTRHSTRSRLLAVVTAAAASHAVHSQIISTSDPAGAFDWRYRYVGNHHAFYYVVTEAATAANSTSGGLVKWPTQTWGGTGWFGYNHHFSTYIRSTTNQRVTFSGGGDDGHSLFVNDTFVAGVPFGQSFTYSLDLKAGEAQKITFAAHQAETPGGFSFSFGPVLGTVPNLQFSATPFPSVPEPHQTLWITTGAIAAFAALRQVNKRMRRS